MSMLCPRCKDALLETNRSGVTVDICPSCHGIWLDKGELNRLLNEIKDVDDILDKELHSFARKKHFDNDDYYYSYKQKKSSMFKKIFDIFD
ncbi:MAG: zf-TFIIB domain-containing protein [Deltaproteobacteria bacterium]|nr:zf-TFIIB domain-containing protein [Deltaproteobacteria bacterium]